MTKPAKAKKTAQIEQNAIETGEGGALVIVEEPTAETIQITKAEWQEIKVNMEILEAKVKHLRTQMEQKDKKMGEDAGRYHAETGNTETRIGQTEQRSQRLSPMQRYIARAYEVEAVYAQTLGIALGREASVLYATTRYSIYDKFPQLTEDQQNVKKICSTNNIYKEFADLNTLIRELMLTGRNDKKWTINYRDGLYTLARTTFFLLFNELLGLVTNPYEKDIELEELTHFVHRTKDGLERLFGKFNNGVFRLQNWLKRANDQNDVFTKQQAFQEIRNLFPLKSEAPKSVYSALKLDVTDEALENGIRNWSTPRSTTKRSYEEATSSREEGEVEEEEDNIWTRQLKSRKTEL
ncbi:unnamed protein product [Oikopleura dioica]|uniref:Uncharacterized protein n=1 Tax=Oikopleura dioica TaxID=34765 RepID=E4XLC9_OIKDI|nr:unnamed protein product [Oikopleura dioica]